MKNLSDNMRGAVYMMFAMAGYVLNDAMMKLATQELNLYQAIFIRGIVVTLLLGIFVWHKGYFSSFKENFSWPLLLRIIGEMGGAIFFLNALINMPIANITAILQVLPLAVTLAAAVFLGEPVGWRRYIAIGIGFIGVLIIVRPGSEGFDIYAIFAIIAVAWVVLRDLSTRKLPLRTPSVLVGFYTSLAVTLLAMFILPFQPWKPVSLEGFSLLAIAGMFVLFGSIFSVMTMRVGEVGFVSPFRYTILIWAIILGIVVFGDYPDFYTMIGSFIVVATGTYTFYRERSLAKKPAKK